MHENKIHSYRKWRKRKANSYLKGIDNGEVVTFRVPGQGSSPHVGHLFFTLRETNTFRMICTERKKGQKQHISGLCVLLQEKLSCLYSQRSTRGMKNGSLKLREAAMVRTGSRHPSRAPNRISFPMWGSTGRRAKWKPNGVRFSVWSRAFWHILITISQEKINYFLFTCNVCFHMSVFFSQRKSDTKQNKWAFLILGKSKAAHALYGCLALIDALTPPMSTVTPK